MRGILRHFGGSILFTVAALAGAFAVGFFPHRSFLSGFSALFAAAMLGVLETSLSFDNAVVNAKILGGMNAFWRRMFLTVGMIVAVFGMRVVFPVLIVWAVGDLSLGQVATLVRSDPVKFQTVLSAQQVPISGFGGAFLAMVFFRFFMDARKDIHWLGHLERLLGRIGRLDTIWILSTMLVVFGFRCLVPPADRGQFLSAGMGGVLVYLLVDALSEGLRAGKSAQRAVVGGFASFLYLEVLDASFSFDGVIGAFAITNNLAVIALGLGIGAMFVRSLTLLLVDKGTLAKYRYLEHGAYWAIGALSLILLSGSTGRHPPDWFSGLVGMSLIVGSLRSSRNRRET